MYQATGIRRVESKLASGKQEKLSIFKAFTFNVSIERKNIHKYKVNALTAVSQLIVEKYRVLV
jgi:hypothetical protein